MENKGDLERLILPEPSHFGYVTLDMERSIKNLQKYFGIGPFTRMIPNYFNKRYRGKPQDFKMELAFARVENIVYELIQVIQGETVYGDFLNEHGEGIHHLGYEISDLAKWTEAYKKVGVEPIMSGERMGVKWAYFNTQEIVVELLERTPEGKVV
jgi:methylmalonyl-CoA/ethylmalonyl-CoA epimerase